jgi:hypothetical protein
MANTTDPHKAALVEQLRIVHQDLRELEARGVVDHVMALAALVNELNRRQQVQWCPGGASITVTYDAPAFAGKISALRAALEAIGGALGITLAMSHPGEAWARRQLAGIEREAQA